MMHREKLDSICSTLIKPNLKIIGSFKKKKNKSINEICCYSLDNSCNRQKFEKLFSKLKRTNILDFRSKDRLSLI